MNDCMPTCTSGYSGGDCRIPEPITKPIRSVRNILEEQAKITAELSADLRLIEDFLSNRPDAARSECNSKEVACLVDQAEQNTWSVDRCLAATQRIMSILGVN